VSVNRDRYAATAGRARREAIDMTETARPTPNKKLRYERERRCWSQQEVADRVGTTPLNVGRWERGVTSPSPHFRQKLCEVFEKTPQELGFVPENLDTDKTTVAPLSTSAVLPTQEAPAAYWNVPYNRNLLFTGREEILTQLRTALTSEGQPIALCQPQAISGLGGIGKTQTAVEYAYRSRDDYDAVLWARADSADLLTSDFLLIAALLNLPQRNEQDQSLVVKAVLRWFDTHEKWLLILDNADHLEMVSEFIPSAGKGHVLLTTRAHSTGTIAQRIEIEKMGLDEGTVFLLRRMKRLRGNAELETMSESVRTRAKAIVVALDGLPLALDQAGAYIEETGCSLSDYLKFYKTRRNRLLCIRGHNATGHPEPVATTWSLSFEKVERANPAAAELLRLCAFLHPDEIPEAMIVEGASELGPSLQPVAEDELELNEVIGELRTYSLVRRDPELKLLNMHRLVQAVLKDAMDKETQQEWAERTVRMVNRAFPEVEFPLWNICQRYLPHAQVCAELISRWDLGFSEATNVLNNAGCYLQVRGQYTEAEILFQQALKIRERTAESNGSAFAQSLNNLARLYWDQGRYERAEPLFQRALALREQVLGLNHLDVAQTSDDFASLYWMQGRYEQAESLFQRALAIREQELGTRHQKTADSLNNLALLYWDQGRYEQAESLHKLALTIREEVLGPNHPDTALSLNNLGMLYYKQGKYEQAKPFYQRALVIDEHLLGPKHPNVATDLNNLANLYLKLGKNEQAESLHKRALTIREEVLEPDHPDVAYSLNGLALIYQNLGRYEQAELLHLRALTIREKRLGPNNPRTATTLNNLANLYIDQGKYEQVESLLQRALAIQEHMLGEEHPDIESTLENYATLLRKIGREREAVPLETRAYAIRAKILF
jgi:tetratricopeptide (TPR) repeat protein/transcriptional regulator with XRE-family HTH domain